LHVDSPFFADVTHRRDRVSEFVAFTQLAWTDATENEVVRQQSIAGHHCNTHGGNYRI